MLALVHNKVKLGRIYVGLRGRELEATAVIYKFKEFTDEGKKSYRKERGNGRVDFQKLLDITV